MSNEQPKKDIKALYQFLAENPVSVIAVSGTNPHHPHLSVLYTFLGENKKLYFLTKNETYKYSTLKKNPQVTLITHSEKPPVSVSTEGRVREITRNDDPELFESIFDLATKKLAEHAVDQPPLAKLVDAGSLVIFEVIPQKIIYSDFRKNDSFIFELEA